MLNFADLQTAVGNLIERSDTVMQNKIKIFLNDGWRYLYAQRPWMAALRTSSFSGVSGLDYFITDQSVEIIIDLSQRQTPVVLALQKYYTLLKRNIDIISTTGYPSVATPAGEVGIKTALPSDGTLVVVSSSASDTTQSVRVRGYDANLIPISESVSLNGTSNVTTTNSYSSKEGYEPRFSKDSDTTGIVTISRSSTEIANLAPLERDARYKKWKVFPAFSTNLTMYITWKKRMHQLSANADTPSFECDNALIMFAYARCLQEKRQIAKANEVYGKKDIDGSSTPGSFLAELDALIAKEPQFSENFTEQWSPIISRDPTDMPHGQGGFQLWPAQGS